MSNLQDTDPKAVANYRQVFGLEPAPKRQRKPAPETQKQMRAKFPKKTSTRQKPDKAACEANLDFEMTIRADRRLSITGRLLWLLYALSANNEDCAFARNETMAQQLNSKARQIRDSLNLIDKSGFFRRERPVGVHRATRWRRNYAEGETPDQFKRRLQMASTFDLAVRLHWVACDLTADDDDAEFGSCGFENGRRTMLKARQKMRDVGYFAVETTPGRPTHYQRLDGARPPPSAAEAKSDDQEDASRPLYGLDGFDWELIKTDELKLKFVDWAAALEGKQQQEFLRDLMDFHGERLEFVMNHDWAPILEEKRNAIAPKL